MWFSFFLYSSFSGSLHSVRLHAVSLGHPVVGDDLYQNSCRTFAGFPLTPLSLKLQKKLIALHKKLLMNEFGPEKEKEEIKGFICEKKDNFFSNEPLMLLPVLMREHPSCLYTWSSERESSGIKRESEAFYEHFDELSPLLNLPPLKIDKNLLINDSFPQKDSSETPSTLLQCTDENTAVCQCAVEAKIFDEICPWRKFQ